MIKRLIALLLIVLGLFGGLFGAKFLQIQHSAQARRPPPPPVVAVTQVRKEQWQPYLTAVGSLVATSGIDVSNEVAGMVTALHFRSGQSVEQGQLLLDLETETDRAELDGLLASRRLARLKFDRQARLLSDRVTSRSDYDEARAVLDQARAAVVAKRALIAKKHVQAPFSGRLGIRAVDLGQYLPPGSAIVPLQSLDPIYVDFTLPEAQLGRVKTGQKVELTVPAYPGERFAGQVSATDPGVDQGTRAIRVRATLDNPGRRLRPGMFAQVRLLAGAPRSVLTLPATAITYNPYGDSVFRVVTQGPLRLARRRQIEIGERRQGRVEVVRHLEAGDTVVSAGQVKLRSGMEVTLAEDPAPSERAQAP